MIVLKYSKFFLVLTQSPPKTACYTSCPPVKFLFHNSPVFAFSTRFHSGLGTSQSESRLEDAFSDEENGSGYDGSPTHQSYRPHSFSGYISPGGDISDEDICGGISTSSGPPGFDYISGGGSQPSTPHQQQCARSRSGSCASRRSQYR